MRVIPERWHAEQDPHCCHEGQNDPVELAVHSHDGGGGRYISITTDGWSFESADEIQAFADALKACLRQAQEVDDAT